MIKERKIKGLRSQLKILEGDAQALKIAVSNAQKEYQAKRNLIKSIKAKIESFENEYKSIRISEHAIVRFFERVKGFDIKSVEKEILSKEVLDLVEKLGGTGGYPNKGFKVVMKDHVVTTITN